MSNAKIYYGGIPVGEGIPNATNVIDNLTSTDPDIPLSANQGYILSQQFLLFDQFYFHGLFAFLNLSKK